MTQLLKTNRKKIRYYANQLKKGRDYFKTFDDWNNMLTVYHRAQLKHERLTGNYYTEYLV